MREIILQPHDKVKKPVAIDPVTDPEGAIEYLIGLLPPELQDASQSTGLHHQGDRGDARRRVPAVAQVPRQSHRRRCRAQSLPAARSRVLLHRLRPRASAVLPLWYRRQWQRRLHQYIGRSARRLRDNGAARHEAAEMRPMRSGARLMLFASAFAGMPCCSATLITTEASSRMAAIPEPSLAPDRKTSAGQWRQNAPCVTS